MILLIGILAYFINWKTLAWFGSICLIWFIKCRFINKIKNSNKRLIGFFHPYCDAGGGGERVLWMAVKSLQKTYDIDIVIYSGDIESTPQNVLLKCEKNFQIILNYPVKFVWLKSRFLVEAKYWPMFTLAGQSFGSLLLCMEAFWKCTPDIFIDSMGYAFTYPFASIIGCKIACYVHYPTISTDMLEKVSSGNAAHNNSPFIANSFTLSLIKHYYYKLFAWTYGIVGRKSSVIMVNSTWTKNHIENIWKINANKIFPPVDVHRMITIPLNFNKRKNIVSIAQFRPEKNHQLQITSFATMLEKNINIKNDKNLKLQLIGSVRNKEDEKRVEDLKTLIKSLKIEEMVDIHINVTYDELIKFLSEAKIGLHTMWNEHFGIGIVECMAAGAITLAHDSGGPKMDIIENNRTGFLANTELEYASIMEKIINLQSHEFLNIQKLARESINRFSNSSFETGFINSISSLV